MTGIHLHARRRLLGLLVACTVFALVAPACSSGPGSKIDTAQKTDRANRPALAPAEQPKGVDPCRLLTIKQIKAATGWDLEKGEHDVTAPKSAGAVCNWERIDREAAVHVQFHAKGGSALLGERRRSLAGRGSTRMPHPVTVKGASEAFEVAPEGLLAIRVGDSYIQVSVIGGTVGTDDHLQLGADVADALT